uniref:Protein sleepless n=1 Tax=Haemonchus contortus TaxID=6289 RepID=W6NKY8_HAECO
MKLFAFTFTALLLNLKTTFSLKCHQCNGWLGSYPLRFTQASTCDNRNNHCETNNYCVRILDTMNPGVEYVTFKSDCYYQANLQVNPQNLSYVQSGSCFPYQDGSAPVKRWFYCFCNDRDYCNTSITASLFPVTIMMILKCF